VRAFFADTFYFLALVNPTDCISFVVMERFGLREALTGDRYFEQAGYAALLV